MRRLGAPDGYITEGHRAASKRHVHNEVAQLRQNFKLPPRQRQELMMTPWGWSVKGPSADVVKFSLNGLSLLGIDTGAMGVPIGSVELESLRS